MRDGNGVTNAIVGNGGMVHVVVVGALRVGEVSAIVVRRLGTWNGLSGDVGSSAATV